MSEPTATPAGPETPSPPTATPAAPAAPAAPPPGAPPAAGVVVTGPRTEREIDLEAELATERERHAATANEKKAREIRVAELEDELHRLKSVGAVPPPARPAKVKRKLLFTTVLDDEEEN